jgi:hypothetical protein
VGVYKETGQYFMQFVIYWTMLSQAEFFFGIEREMVMFTPWQSKQNDIFHVLSSEYRARSCHMKIANKFFGNVAKFEYFKMTLTNQIAFMEKLRVN